MVKEKKKIEVKLAVTIISLTAVFALVSFLVIRPEETLRAVNAAFDFATQVFGVPLMVFTFITTVLAIYLAFGKYGNIKLGDCEPEFSTFSYITMMASAALASAAVYWSFTEWAQYYMKPGLGIEPYSLEAAELSLGYSFFHWGFATQAPYVLTGVAIGYAVYNRHVPLMNVSAVCEYMMGDFKYKKLLGTVIDISVVFCIVAALGCSLGLAVPLCTGALKQVFGIETTFVIQICVVLVIATVFSITSCLGVNKGMKRISSFATTLCILFLAYLLIAGPTGFIVENFFSSLAWMGDKYLRMSFFTDPIAQTGFTEEWTTFFQAFCLTYTAMMGIFVAKISKGRTIRQVSLCCMLGVSIGVWVLFAVDGGLAMNAEFTGAISVTDILNSGAGQDLIYKVVELVPGGAKLVPLVMLLFIGGFVASNLDSASFSLAQTTTLKMEAHGNTNKVIRLMWCAVLTFVPLSMMFAGADFSALKSIAILASIPFMFVVIYIEVKLFKWMREDYNKITVIEKEN